MKTKMMNGSKERRKLVWSNMVKDDIAHATADLFVNEGSGKATMDKIASAIGMTKPNLYRYFDSRMISSTCYSKLIQVSLKRFVIK
jgi:AcrR family transcriptional regulator